MSVYCKCFPCHSLRSKEQETWCLWRQPADSMKMRLVEKKSRSLRIIEIKSRGIYICLHFSSASKETVTLPVWTLGCTVHPKPPLLQQTETMTQGDIISSYSVRLSLFGNWRCSHRFWNNQQALTPRNFIHIRREQVTITTLTQLGT
jgi:hypothetical protein